MRAFIIRRWKVLVPVGALVGAVGIYLAFFVFGFHLLVVDDKVDEAAPAFAADTAGSDETPTASVAPVPTVVEATKIETILSGSFIDRSHPAEGLASVLTDGSEQRFLRFEEFATDNGPDLDVYLSTASADGAEGDFDDDFVHLGELKGNIGDQNYEIPPEVDLERYSTVVIWCGRFRVAFGAAELS